MLLAVGVLAAVIPLTVSVKKLHQARVQEVQLSADTLCRIML